MKWNAEYSIGLATIDSQHKQIFEHLLSMENSILKRDPRHVMRSLTAELAYYLKFHFAVEEALMEIIKYPALEDHRAAHAKLNDSMLELETRIRQSQSATDLVGFFEEWFVGHVLHDDRAYAAYIGEKFPMLTQTAL